MKTEPTPEEIHELAPKANMLFCLAMVLESLATDMENEKMKEHSANLRGFVNHVTPEVAEKFGDWAEYVEIEIMCLNASSWQLASVIICEIRQLSFDITNFYRTFDKQFVFVGKHEISQLYSIKMLSYTKALGVEFRSLVKKLMEQ